MECLHGVVKHHRAQYMRAPGSLSKSIFPKEFEFMYKHDSKHWISSQGGTLYTRSRPRCLMRYLYMWGSSSCFILISNERRISHKLFAQCVCARFGLTQSLDLTSLPMRDCRGPLCAHPHILNTCSGAEDGYSRHVKQWQGRWDHLGFVSGMTVE